MRQQGARAEAAPEKRVADLERDWGRERAQLQARDAVEAGGHLPREGAAAFDAGGMGTRAGTRGRGARCMRGASPCRPAAVPPLPGAQAAHQRALDELREREAEARHRLKEEAEAAEADLVRVPTRGCLTREGATLGLPY